MNTNGSSRKPGKGTRRRCGKCAYARWAGKRKIGKCLDPEQLKHSHCLETWPDGTMKIERDWGTKCPRWQPKGTRVALLKPKGAKKRRKRSKRRFPVWLSDFRVDDAKGIIRFKCDFKAGLADAGAKDMIGEFSLYPKTNAVVGAGLYDYILELHIGKLVLPVSAALLFPDESTHGREFFDKTVQMLRDAGAFLRPKQ